MLTKHYIKIIHKNNTKTVKFVKVGALKGPFEDPGVENGYLFYKYKCTIIIHEDGLSYYLADRMLISRIR